MNQKHRAVGQKLNGTLHSTLPIKVFQSHDFWQSACSLSRYEWKRTRLGGLSPVTHTWNYQFIHRFEHWRTMTPRTWEAPWAAFSGQVTSVSQLKTPHWKFSGSQLLTLPMWNCLKAALRHLSEFRACQVCLGQKKMSAVSVMGLLWKWCGDAAFPLPSFFP